MGLTNGLGLIQNCAYYASLTSGYGCMSCIKGYRGILKDDTGDGYIESCVKFTDCDSTKDVQHGIHSNVTVSNYPFITTYNNNMLDLNTHFNGCASCTNAASLLVAFVGSTNKIVQYDNATLSSTNAPVSFGYNIECIAAGATFGGVVFTLPANCAKVIAFVK